MYIASPQRRQQHRLCRDSIVGLVLVIILSIMDRSYIGRALTSDDEEDDSKNKLKIPILKSCHMFGCLLSILNFSWN